MQEYDTFQAVFPANGQRYTSDGDQVTIASWIKDILNKHPPNIFGVQINMASTQSTIVVVAVVSKKDKGIYVS